MAPKPITQATFALTCHISGATTEFPQLVFKNTGKVAVPTTGGVDVAFTSGIKFKTQFKASLAPGATNQMLLPTDLNGVPKGACSATVEGFPAKG